MKLRKMLSLLLIAALVPGILYGCGPQAPVPTGTAPSTDPGTQPNAPTERPTEPTVPSVPEEDLKLTSLSVDGGYSIAFDPEVLSYTVSIPAGRPRIPQISATAESGMKLEIVQATIADSENSGVAVAKISTATQQKSYTVTFVREAAQGFQLQYADQYTYVPAYELKSGESFSFESSDSSVITVSKSGVLNAKKVSQNPVTIKVSAGGSVVEELVVDQVIKAPLNIFLIIGQSNAFGWHDVPPSYNNYYAFANLEKAKSDKPLPGTVWCDDVQNSYDDYSFSGMYDLSVGRSGFSPALGKEWYALTGEKTLMLQTAIGSTPIETWVRDPSLQFFGIDCYAMTVERFNFYKNQLAAENSNFELNRVYGFWLQGESCQEYVYSSETFTWAFKHNIPNYSYIGDWKTPTAPGQLMTSKQYSDYFMDMYNAFVEDVGLEFIGILPVRAMYSVSTRENRNEQTLVDMVPARAAQFMLNYMNHDNIAFVTLKTEIGRTESYADKTVEGWGYMGCNNIHYNQLGYNALGKDAAINTFAIFNAETDRTATSIEVIDKNGRGRLADGDEIVISVGESYQISAIVLPLYTDMEELTFTVADTSVCTIDEFGLITAPNAASAAGKTTTVTITNGDIVRTITVRIAR